MTKNLIKVMAVVLMAVMLVAAVSTVANAASRDDKEYSFDEIDTQFVKNGAKDTTGTAKTVNNIIGSILTVVQVIGMGVAVIMLIVLAIKYISAAPGDKADIKKHAVVYIVGAVVLFAATGILQLVKNFAGVVDSSVAGN